MKKIVDNHFIWWIVNNALPFRIGESNGFENFVKALNRNYKPPKKDKVKKLICEMYDVKKGQLCTFLSDVKWVSLTSDGWKDVSNQIHYTGLTLHFIDNYELMSVCLKTSEFHGDATASNLEQVFKESLDEWCINSDIITSFTTDGASNFKKAAKAIAPHIHCVAHQLNLVVCDSLEKDLRIAQLVTAVKTIVTLFKKSDVLMRELMQERERKGLSKLKLIQDVATRWNSTFYMLQRYMELHNEISHVLLYSGKRDIDLSDAQIECIGEIVSVLEVFEEITCDISGESYITISRIIPLIASAKVILEKKRMNNEISKNLISSLRRGLDNRFGEIEKDKLFAYSTLLDPRFKKVSFFSTADCALMVSKLNGELTEVELSQRPPIEADEDEPNIWKVHSKRVRALSDPTAGMHSGLKHYLDADVLPRKSNPLIFWKDNKDNWPHLHNLALRYLTIQPTSVPCERLFSKAGSIITEKRNRIKPVNVDKLCFLSSLPESFI
ncbi:zinc finger BED domain-containing protein 4-like [Tetranychus urticae]|uniref:zinc finger BED domain-containing protein 4-like n=1 Tax=Tetranychus urticae TaxID=32264 RepID=UPI00077C0961|nr:zinc finger BED domain-containing protein 4-like [Tetranychus urticae]